MISRCDVDIKYYLAENGPKQFLPLPDERLDWFLTNQNNCPGCNSTNIHFVRNTAQATTYTRDYLNLANRNQARAFTRAGYDHNAFSVKHCLNCGVLLVMTRWRKPTKGVRKRVVLDAVRIRSLLEKEGKRQ